MYYDYLFNMAISKNAIKEFMIGIGDYKEKGSNHCDEYVVDYKSRYQYLCEYNNVKNKNAFDNSIALLILDLLNGNNDEFLVGICYVRSMCYLLNDNIQLQIDFKSFLIKVNEILKRREIELKESYLTNSAFKSMWDLVEYNDDLIARKSGIKLL